MTGLTVVLVLLVLAALWLTTAWRGLAAARGAADATWVAIDLHLRERQGLVALLIATVQAEAAADDAALARLVAAREHVLAVTTPWERAAAERQLVAAIAPVADAAARHPRLGRSSVLADVEARLTAIEGALQSCRRIYNADVRLYRTRRGHLPGSLLRRFGDFADRPYFELDHTQRERTVPTLAPPLARAA
ncbi:MAG TPA: LemA family protein [Baekduia sp.]|uniref:LemA family protein n=1 Tax=Baekduia sp. TaxID=2600305 RepID=UPI002D76B520|nr:LemA family protein [Baekduia sp.]HET6508673.1 LemA family protein [Baekduia sp.]